jgi:hypothetical protein
MHCIVGLCLWLPPRHAPQRPQLAPVLGPFLRLFVQPADRDPVKGFVDVVPTKPFLLRARAYPRSA